MKVIGINASPRKNANTQTLVEAVLAGAKKKRGANPPGQPAGTQYQRLPGMRGVQKTSGQMRSERRSDVPAPGSDGI